jgi:hypothetical protein
MESNLLHRHDLKRLSAAETMLIEAIELAGRCKDADGAIVEGAVPELIALLTGAQAGRNYRFLHDELHQHQRRRRVTRHFVG